MGIFLFDFFNFLKHYITFNKIQKVQKKQTFISMCIVQNEQKYFKTVPKLTGGYSGYDFYKYDPLAD